MFKSKGVIVLCLCVLAGCVNRVAGAWDFVSEFSGMENPSGVWSYGWGTGLNDFDTYDLVQSYAAGGGPMWLETEGDQNTGPILWKNDDSTVAYGVLPGEIAQHPSQAGEHCKVRWAAPVITESYIRITGLWGIGDGGERDFWVVKNGGEVLLEVTGTVGDVPVNLILDNDGITIIDFIQGRGADWGYENTPFSVTITPTDTLTCQEKGEYWATDMNRDCYVDLQDFVLFAEDWLLCYDPDDSECEDYSDILSRKEMVRAEQWITEKFTASQPEPLFSFNYDGVSSADFLSSWSFVSSSSLLDEHRTKYIHTYTDPATGLEVRCEAVAYDDFPTVEWTVYFQNTSSVDAPILENIQTINTIFGSSSGGEYLLHRNRGDFCAASSYQPLQEYLNKNVTKAIANAGGRPTNYEFPYFNVENNGQGLIYVLSWAGQWTASFRRNDDNSLRITGGQELTHFKLLPGEQVRSPLVVVQFYMGDWIRAQNIWRRWMVAHNLPRRNGQMIQPFSSLCSGLHFEGLMTNAAGEKEFIDRSLDENIQVDYWWQDAGWYPCDGVGWPKTGTWEPDPVRFPNGLREVSDYAHARNIGPLVWFEPERIHSDTWLSINHPEWIYGGSGGGLLKLGDPACRQWLIDHFDNLITSEAIDFYRQDFNIDPLGYWRGNDAADRQGITEIKHIEGYFAFWDELISRHPGLWIDSCSSGGRRNDLETLRRAVPLLRSDYYADPVGQQGHTYGISMWFPFYGTGFDSYDLYLLRSIYSPEFEIASDMRNMSLNYDVMRQGFNEWKQISNYLLGDYYPLTPYSISSSSWIAWQFDQPDVGEGVVQAFRRSNAGNAEMTFKLKGLDVHAFYAVTNFDVPGEQIRSGGQLMFEGLTIAIDEQPGSAVITYKIR